MVISPYYTIYKFKGRYENENPQGAGMMAHWLRAFTALTGNWGLIPNTHMWLTAVCNSIVPRDPMPQWVPGTYVIHRHIW